MPPHQDLECGSISLADESLQQLRIVKLAGVVHPDNLAQVPQKLVQRFVLHGVVLGNGLVFLRV